MDSIRARNYVVGTAERMGIVRTILNGANVCDELWDLFMHLPEDDLHETFSILLHYHVPDRALLTKLLEHREPWSKAMPPSNEQLGFLRDPNNLWNSPLQAPRCSLWDYLLFRWSTQYFDRTMQLMLKSFSSFDDLATLLNGISSMQTVHILTATIVAHHSSILNLLAPRIRLMLDETDYCRDCLEYNEMLLMAQYIFMSGDVSQTVKNQFPFERLFQWGAGMNPNIQSNPLRIEAVITIGAVENDVLQTWVRNCTDPHLVPSLCRILTELPTEIHYIPILALSFSNLLIDIAWDTWHRPFLYESTIHVLLSAEASVLNAVLASHLFLRLSQAFPRRNIIETCFYAFTNVLQTVKNEPLFMHQIEENLRGAMMTNGNRSVFINLVSLQELEVQNVWIVLFPLLKWPNKSVHVLYDSVTEQAIIENWHFEANDNTPVGLETVIHHVAANGLRNPFTNLSITWEHLMAVNKKSS